MSRSTSPLRVPALRRLLTGYAVSGLGDWFGEIALSVVIFHATGSVLAVSALWIAGRIVPAIIGPPLILRLARVRVPLLYAAEAAVFAVVAVAAAERAPITVLMALSLLDGTLALAARTLTKTAIVAAAEPMGALAEANRLLGIVFGASMAFGPALAGIAVATVGPATALAFDSASFLVAGVLLARGRGIAPASARRVPLREAFGRVRRSSSICLLLLVDGATGICFALILPVELVSDPALGPTGSPAASSTSHPAPAPGANTDTTTASARIPPTTTSISPASMPSAAKPASAGFVGLFDRRVGATLSLGGSGGRRR